MSAVGDVRGRSAPLIEVESLTHRYRRTVALDGVSFVARGGVTVVLGPNGAGKSTLMRLLAGQLRRQEGRITIEGEDQDRSASGSTGYLAQEPQLFGRFTCTEFVTYCGWLRGLTSRDAERAAVAALAKVDLVAVASSRTSTLSGGMRRRLAIAAVIAPDPAVVLLDEPMSGLDPEQRADVRSTVQALGRGATVLLSTHILQDVPALADSVFLLRGGRAAFSGPVEEFLGGPPSAASTEDVERAYARWTRECSG